MKKLFINLITLSLLTNISLAENYNVVITKEHTKYNNGELTTPEPSIPSSCKDILDNGNSIGDGIYEITVNSKSFNVRCNMTTSGGGWTLVVAQYELDRVEDWNEGIQSDYLEDNKGFALNSQELPEHTQMAIGQTDYEGWSPTTEVFNYVYTTGDIELENITSETSQETYQIHRNASYYFSGHDPQYPVHYTDYMWVNTLTVDHFSSGYYHYTYAFSPLNVTYGNAGYSYLGARSSTQELGAWTVWVR